jgi:hypothetical protein
MTAFRAWLLESVAELAASDAHPSDPNMHPVATVSADRRVVWGTAGAGSTGPAVHQPHERHVALDYKTFLIEGAEKKQ